MLPRVRRSRGPKERLDSYTRGSISTDVCGERGGAKYELRVAPKSADPPDGRFCEPPDPAFLADAAPFERHHRYTARAATTAAAPPPAPPITPPIEESSSGLSALSGELARGGDGDATGGDGDATGGEGDATGGEGGGG